MTTIQIDKLEFSFPEDWQVTKYDDWAFYQRHFKDCCTGNKGVDLLAFDPHTRTLWLLEVKDYRLHRREKQARIWDEIAQKTRDTLAGLMAAQVNSSASDERVYARRSVRARKLRVVFHFEQPTHHSKLFPRIWDPADVQQKLRQMMRPIDPHVVVVDTQDLPKMDWTVT